MFPMQYSHFSINIVCLITDKNWLYLTQNDIFGWRLTCRAFNNLEVSIQWFVSTTSQDSKLVFEPVFNNITNEVRLRDEIYFVVKSEIIFKDTWRVFKCVASNSQNLWEETITNYDLGNLIKFSAEIFIGPNNDL